MSSELTIYQAMAAILADVDYIGKDRQADMGNAGKYKFRGIDDIYNALHKSFARYGVFIIPKIIQSELDIQEKEKTYNGVTTKTYSQSAKLTIEFTFASADGSSITAVGFGYALDTSDKAATKAQSAALKYCLMQTFLIPTEESKDVEDSHIEIALPVAKKTLAPLPVSKTGRSIEHNGGQVAEKTLDTPQPKIAPYSEDIKTRQQALRECCEILEWTPEYKADWVKTISRRPVTEWDLNLWDLAVVKALAAIDQMNSEPVLAEVV